MKNNLLGILTNIVLPISIILLAIVISVFLYRLLQRKFNKPLDTTIKQNETPQIKLKERYCTEEEMKFLEALHKALPRDFIAFPNVGVSKLIEPKGNLNDYKSIQDKYVDICVFLRKEMKPILVIDLYQPSPTAQQLKKFDDNISNVLKVAKIPVLHQQIQKTYNLNTILTETLNSIDGKIVTQLKNNIIRDSVRK